MVTRCWRRDDVGGADWQPGECCMHCCSLSMCHSHNPPFFTNVACLLASIRQQQQQEAYRAQLSRLCCISWETGLPSVFAPLQQLGFWQLTSPAVQNLSGSCPQMLRMTMKMSWRRAVTATMGPERQRPRRAKKQQQSPAQPSLLHAAQLRWARCHSTLVGAWSIRIGLTCTGSYGMHHRHVCRGATFKAQHPALTKSAAGSSAVR